MNNSLAITGDFTMGATSGSGSLTLNPTAVTSPSAGTISLTGARTITVPGNTQSIIGNIVGSASPSLTKAGNLDLVLTNNTGAASTFGNLSVNAGRLFVTANSSANGQNTLGAGTVNVSNGAILGFNVTGGITPTSSITFASGAGVAARTAAITLNTATVSFPTAGTMSFNNDDTATFAINVTGNYPTLTGNLQIDVGGTRVAAAAVGTVNIPGNIGGTGGLTKAFTGALVLGGTNTYSGVTTVNAGTLQFGKQVSLYNNTPASWTDTNIVVSSGATLALNVGGTGEFTTGNIAMLTALGTVAGGFNSGSFLALDTANAGGTFVHGSAIDNPNGGANILNLTKLGAGTLALTAANTYSGTTTVSAGTLQIGNAGTTGTLGTGPVVNNATLAFNRTNAISVANAISGTGGVTQAGIGVLTFDGVAKTYSGTTTIGGGGTLALALDHAFTGGLTFGLTASATTVGALDLSAANASFGGALLVQTNSATANTITVANGRTLTIGGNVTIGPNNTGTSTTTNLTVTGGGAMSVNNTASASTIQIGLTQNTANSANRATLDLTGLNAFTASLNTTNGVFRVNNTSGTNVNNNVSTLLMPTTGDGDATITVKTFSVGDGGSNGGTAPLTNIVKLGSGVTTINADTLNVGTGGRDVGSIGWDPLVTTGSLVVRAANTTGRAAWNIGTGNANTGVSVGTGNLVDFTGHKADLLLSNLTIGSQNRNTPRTDTFILNSGDSILDVTAVVVGTNVGTANTTAANSTWTANLNIGGGTVIIGSGGLDIANGTTAVTGTDVISGNVNVSGGTVSVANSATLGGAIRLGTNSVATGLTANGTLSMTGGKITVAGDIVKGSATGSSSATVTLDGGTLDLAGFKLGGTRLINTLNLNSGKLENVGQINNGADLVKTTIGTLTLSGTQTYSGATRVRAGTLIVSGPTASLGDASGGTIVDSGATLALDGGAVIANEELILNGVGAAGQSGALVSISGNNSIDATSTLAAQDISLGEIRLASLAGTFTIDSDIDLRYSKLSVDGAGEILVNGDIVGVGMSGTGISPENYASTTQVFANVAEASAYTLLYELPIPNAANFSSSVPYSINNSAAFTAPFDRIAYYLELQSGTGATQYVYVSMDAYTSNDANVGVPRAAIFQRLVSNMNVASNVAGVVTGTGIATGNIEFWPSNYSAALSATNSPPDRTPSPANASATLLDFGDSGASATPGGHGSMQIHNFDIDGAGAGTAGQTLLAFNNWNAGTSGAAAIGIGNDPNTGRTTYNPDWTFAGTTGVASTSYTIKNLAVLVRETTPRTFNADNSLAKMGSGKLTLNGTNSYTGVTTATGGTLVVDGSVTSNVTVNTPATLNGIGTVTGNVLGTGNFSPGNSPGTMNITGNFTPSGTVNFEVNSGYAVAGTDYDQYIVGGDVDLSAATLTFTNNDDTLAPTANSLLTLISKTSGGATTPSASPAQGSSVTIGSRSFKLFYNGGDGNNVVLGETSPTAISYVDDSFAVNPGQVISNADLGTTGNESAIFGINAFTTIGAALAASAANSTVVVNGGTYAEAVSLAGTRILRITGPDAAQSVIIDSLASVSGTTLQIDSLGTLTIGDATSTTLAGLITGSGGLIKQGTGTLQIDGANTGYSGATTIRLGTILATSASSLGSAAVTLNDSLTTAAGAALRLGGAINLANNLIVGTDAGTPAILGTTAFAGGLATFSGTVTLGDDLTISGLNTGGTTLSGAISGSLQSVAKTGGEIVTLTNASNTYSGTTTVSNGTLALANSTTNNNIGSSSTIIVGGGATLDVTGLGTGINAGRLDLASGQTLSGTGTVSGAVRGTTGSNIAPGTSPGILNVGSVSFTGGNYTVEIGGAAAGNTATDHDQLNVANTVALGEGVATLVLAGTYVPASGDDFVIIDNDGSADTTGFFLGLPEGSPIAFNMKTLFITYNGGDGNDVVLNTNPIINGTTGIDKIILQQIPSSSGQFRYSSDDGANWINLGPITSFTFNGNGGNDLLTVDYANGDAIPGTGGGGQGIFYNGNAHTSTGPGDALVLLNPSGAVTYTPDALINATLDNDGRLDIVGSGSIFFAQIEPMDVIGAPSFTLLTANLANNADTITIADGTTIVGALAAMTISGNSGGTPFELANVRNTPIVVIDAATNDGAGFADTITINTTTGAHGNGSLAINTGGGADVVNLNGNLNLDGSFTLSGVENLVVGATVILDTEQGNNNSAGSVNLGGATVSANGASRDLTINTSVTGAGNNGGAVSLAVFSNAAPGGSFVNDVTINTTSSGGTAGTTTLAGNILLETNGADTGDFTVSGGGNILLSASVTIDTEQGSTSNGGNVDLGGATVSADAVGRSLTINTSTGFVGGNGGNVNLAAFSNATPGAAFVNDLSIDTTPGVGGTAGATTLAGNILLENNGANTGDFTVSGAGNIILAASVTIDTKQSATGNGGTVNVGTSTISGNAAGRDLTLNTGDSASASAVNGGDIVLGTLGNIGGGFYINDLVLDPRKSATGATHGIITLSGDISLDNNGGDLASMTIFGTGGGGGTTQVRLNTSLTIDLEQGANAAGGTFSTNGTGNVQFTATVAGRDLVIDSSGNGTGGTIEIPAMGNAGGAFLNDVTIDSQGALMTLRNFSLDANTNADPASFTVLGSGILRMDFPPRVFDTESGNDNPGGPINFGVSPLQSNSAGNNDISIDTSTTAAGLAGGNVTLGPISANGSVFVNDVTINSAGPGGNGAITLNGNISLSNNGTGDAALLSVVGGGNIILNVAANATLTIDTQNGTPGSVTNQGGVQFGTSAVSATNTGVDLSIDTSNTGGGSNGGNVTLAAFNSAGGNFVNDLTINANAGGTRGDVSFTGAIMLATFVDVGDLTVVIADDITQNAAAAILATGPISWTARNNVTMNAALDASADTITILANQDGTGAQGLLMNTGSSIATTNNTTAAVAITVNTATGGTGNAALRAISAGTTAGRVTIAVDDGVNDADGGEISDAADDALVNITAFAALLTAATGIGDTGTASSGRVLETVVAQLDVTNSASGSIFIADLDDGLTLTNISGPNSVDGVAGAGEIRAASPLTIAANAITSGGMTYTAFDDATDAPAATEEDTLTINAGVTVQDTTASLTLNAGDNLSFAATSIVIAATTVDINVDPVGIDGSGSTVNLAGSVTAANGNLTITTGNEADIVTLTGSLVAGGSGDVQITLNGGADQFNAIVNTASIDVATGDVAPTADTITIDAGAGQDIIRLFSGANGATLLADQIRLRGRDSTNGPNSGNPGDDTDEGDQFFIRMLVDSALADNEYFVDGDDPTDAGPAPLDVLTIDFSALPVGGIPTETHLGNGAGNIMFAGFGTINYVEIENTTALAGKVNHVFDLEGMAANDVVDYRVVDVQLVQVDGNEMIYVHGSSIGAVSPEFEWFGLDDNVNSLTFAGRDTLDDAV
ncbi:MAG: autotransporter-associated beta strand repeat-containing protein, partial [Pirellulaceae bacterium]|nr:autotransporter-associated beta strand repeat-containing protein [Pirellulaceae bacterium]